MESKMITTKYERDIRVEIEQPLLFIEDIGIEEHVINIYPDVQFQEIQGFGGAFTDSAGYVFSLMSETDKKRLAETYYGKGGIGYTLGRLHLDSCDFSLEEFEAIVPGDVSLDSFDMSRSGKYILPLAEAAQNSSGAAIEFMASLWSPPAFTKTNGLRLQGGKLKPEYMDFFAEYICHYIKEYRQRGVFIKKLTPQNEPKAVQTWDSCIYTAEEEKLFIRDFLHPALEKNGLGDAEIYIWDHNKERVYERAVQLIDETTDGIIKGVAFHWYSGDHFEALDLIKRRFPHKKLAQTEACIEFRTYIQKSLLNSEYITAAPNGAGSIPESPDKAEYVAAASKTAGSSPESLNNAERYAHDIIGSLNAGMDAFYDWNLLLDEQGGPNHAKNYCEAPFMYDIGKNLLIENPSLYYIAHFSRYIKPGAIRLGISTYSPHIETTALRNPDGGIAAVMLNRTQEDRPVVLRISGRQTVITLPKRSISTLVIY
ncbi:glycosyl hydrolase [Clostridia bacterium]|nr:glycosyl hydrolase [Clostridia bacterium]